MNWITDKAPSISGPYYVSLEQKVPLGKYVFVYVAYYDSENKKWHKFDPFQDVSKRVQEEIEGVVAWCEENGPFVK